MCYFLAPEIYRHSTTTKGLGQEGFNLSVGLPRSVPYLRRTSSWTFYSIFTYLLHQYLFSIDNHTHNSGLVARSLAIFIYNFTCTLMYGILTSSIRRPLELRFVLSGMHLTRLNLCFRSDVLEEACHPLPPDKLCCARLWKAVNLVFSTNITVTRQAVVCVNLKCYFTGVPRFLFDSYRSLTPSLHHLASTLESNKLHRCWNIDNFSRKNTRL